MEMIRVVTSSLTSPVPTVRTGGTGAGGVVDVVDVVVREVDQRVDRWRAAEPGDDIGVDVESVEWRRVPLTRPRPRRHRRRGRRRRRGQHVQTGQRSQHVDGTRPSVVQWCPRRLIVRHNQPLQFLPLHRERQQLQLHQQQQQQQQQQNCSRVKHRMYQRLILIRTSSTRGRHTLHAGQQHQGSMRWGSLRHPRRGWWRSSSTTKDDYVPQSNEIN